LGKDGVLEGVLKQAGFAQIEVRKVDAPLKMSSAADYTRYAQESFGALQLMMASLSEAQRADVWREVEDAMRSFETPVGFEGQCELLVGVGTNP
jgi:hypothetical protein